MPKNILFLHHQPPTLVLFASVLFLDFLNASSAIRTGRLRGVAVASGANRQQPVLSKNGEENDVSRAGVAGRTNLHNKNIFGLKEQLRTQREDGGGEEGDTSSEGDGGADTPPQSTLVYTPQLCGGIMEPHICGTSILPSYCLLDTEVGKFAQIRCPVLCKQCLDGATTVLPTTVAEPPSLDRIDGPCTNDTIPEPPVCGSVITTDACGLGSAEGLRASRICPRTCRTCDLITIPAVNRSTPCNDIREPGVDRNSNGDSISNDAPDHYTVIHPSSCRGVPEAVACGSRILVSDCADVADHGVFARLHCPVISTTRTSTTRTSTSRTSTTRTSTATTVTAVTSATAKTASSTTKAAAATTIRVNAASDSMACVDDAGCNNLQPFCAAETVVGSNIRALCPVMCNTCRGANRNSTNIGTRTTSSTTSSSTGTRTESPQPAGSISTRLPSDAVSEPSSILLGGNASQSITSAENEHKKLSTGSIVAIIIGSLAFVLAVGIMCRQQACVCNITFGSPGGQEASQASFEPQRNRVVDSFQNPTYENPDAMVVSRPLQHRTSRNLVAMEEPTRYARALRLPTAPSYGSPALPPRNNIKLELNTAEQQYEPFQPPPYASTVAAANIASPLPRRTYFELDQSAQSVREAEV
eukprot:gene14274-11473_t